MAAKVAKTPKLLELEAKGLVTDGAVMQLAELARKAFQSEAVGVASEVHEIGRRIWESAILELSRAALDAGHDPVKELIKLNSKPAPRKRGAPPKPEDANFPYFLGWYILKPLLDAAIDHAKKRLKARKRVTVDELVDVVTEAVGKDASAAGMMTAQTYSIIWACLLDIARSPGTADPIGLLWGDPTKRAAVKKKAERFNNRALRQKKKPGQ